MTALYQKLKNIAKEHPHLLKAYHRDLLVHDRRRIRSMRVGEQWLWLLRNHGTVLFPIGAGQNPIWISHHLDECSSALVALVTVTDAERSPHLHIDGVVKIISHDKAKQLATAPAPKGRLVLQPSLFRGALVRDGRLVGEIIAINDMLAVDLDGERLGGYSNWPAALEAIEGRVGYALGPTVAA